MESRICFHEDADGPRVELLLEAPDGVDGTAKVQVFLGLEEDRLDRDPVLAVQDLSGAVWFRSQALPGLVFQRLKEVYEARGGEGFSLVRIRPEGEVQGILDAEFLLDFTGAHARGRVHQAEGRIQAAFEEFGRSPLAPIRDLARGLPAPSEGTSPAEAAPSLRGIYQRVLAAIARDGKLDREERQVFEALKICLPMPEDQLGPLLKEAQQLAKNPDPEAGPLDPSEVFQEILREALAGGRIGPQSKSLLGRLAQALGLKGPTLEALVAEVVGA